MKRLLTLFIFLTPWILDTQADTLFLSIQVVENRLDNLGLISPRAAVKAGAETEFRFFVDDTYLTPEAGDTNLITTELGLSRQTANPNDDAWSWQTAIFQKDSAEQNIYSISMMPAESDTGIWYILGRASLPDQYQQYAGWNGFAGGEYDGRNFITASFTVLSQYTSVAQNIPAEFNIHSPYPNPFNPATHIQIDLPESSNLQLFLYNLRGQKVAVIADTFTEAGYHTYTINGSLFASGIYLLSIQSSYGQFTKKIMLLK